LELPSTNSKEHGFAKRPAESLENRRSMVDRRVSLSGSEQIREWTGMKEVAIAMGYYQVGYYQVGYYQLGYYQLGYSLTVHLGSGNWTLGHLQVH